MHFLANVPAKLKEILNNWNTRLSSARAAKIDNLDATISSRAPASTALSNTVWTNTRAGKLDNLDTTVSSRLNLGGLQSELNSRSVTATRLNRLDATVSSRLSSSDASLDVLKPISGIHTFGGFFVYDNISFYSLPHVAKYTVPGNTNTWQVIYSRTGKGGIVCAAALLYRNGIGFRIIIDGTVLWSATATVAYNSTGFAGPIGCFSIKEINSSSQSVYYNSEGPIIKYNSSVSIEAYAELTGEIYYKEYRY